MKTNKGNKTKRNKDNTTTHKDTQEKTATYKKTKQQHRTAKT